MIDKDLEIWQKVRESEMTDTITIGPSFTDAFIGDPKHLLFTLARYKFAAKMIQNNPKPTVLEVGCSEGFGTFLLSQVAESVIGVDFDEKAIKWAQDHYQKGNMKFFCKDFKKDSMGQFDSVVSLDVIEHVSHDKEDDFVNNLFDNLKEDGTLVVGTPNITSNVYANHLSQLGHINLFDHNRLKELFQKRFKHVFLFGMNDEVVHTGFPQMSHYLMLIACGKK